MQKWGKAEHNGTCCRLFGICQAANGPYINIFNTNSLWSTNSWQIAFGCLPNVHRIVECCLPHLGNTSTLNDRFSFACRIHILFMFRCKTGFRQNLRPYRPGMIILIKICFKTLHMFPVRHKGKDLLLHTDNAAYDWIWYSGKLQTICGFFQGVRCVWQNKELTPKGKDVKLITRWKHVPDTAG